MKPSVDSLSAYLWFFEILLGIGALFFVNFLFVKFLKHIRQKALTTSVSWKEKIEQIFALPFRLLLWLLAITLMTEVLSVRFGFSFFDDYIKAFRSSGVVLCTAWVLLRWKAAFQHNFLAKERSGKKIDAGFLHVIGKILTVCIILLSFLILFQIWGVNILPLVAFGGVGAAALGFAAKDVIANFFGGLMLYINRPFMVGDWILLPHHQVEGSVEEMGWYTTCVRDKEKRPLYLPNALFSSVLVINASRMTHRRIEEKIYIQHRDFSKLSSAVEKMRMALSAHPDVDTALPLIVVFHHFTQTSIEIYIDCYTLQTRYEKYLMTKHEILTHLYTLLSNEGVKPALSPLHVELGEAFKLFSLSPGSKLL